MNTTKHLERGFVNIRVCKFDSKCGSMYVLYERLKNTLTKVCTVVKHPSASRHSSFLFGLMRERVSSVSTIWASGIPTAGMRVAVLLLMMMMMMGSTASASSAPIPLQESEAISYQPEPITTLEQGQARLSELNAAWQQGITPDSLLLEIDKLLETADRQNLPELLGQTLELLYGSLNQRRLYREGIQALESRFQRYARKLTPVHRVETEIYLALFAYELRDLDKVEARFARLLSETDNPRLRAVIQTNWANAKVDRSEFDAAIQLHLEAVNYYLEQQNNQKIAGIYLNIGSIFIRIEEPDKALEYFLLARDVAEGVEDPMLQITILSNIGIVYKQREQYEEALAMYEEGLRLSEEAGIPLRMAQNLLNIGNIKVDLDQPELAVKDYERVLEISRANQIPYGLALGYINITNAYKDLREFEMALQMADSAVFYADQIGLRGEKNALIGMMSDIYEEQGEYRRALEYRKEYVEAFKELNDEEKRRNIAEIEEKYESELKDQQLALQEQDLEVAGLRNRQLMLVIGFLGLMLGASVFYYRSRNRYLQDLYDRNIELMRSEEVGEAAQAAQAIALEESQAQVRTQEEARDADTDADKRIDESGYDTFEDTAQESTQGVAEDTTRDVAALADTKPEGVLLYERIVAKFRRERIHLNPMLSLRDISMAVNSNDKYVSTTIAENSGMNVSSMINYYRVDEAKKIIVAQPECTIQEVMDASGFNSRTTFYNSFRKVTGMSPSQFMSRSRDRG